MTHSFLERIGQPEVGLANHREESAPFNVHDATSILEFSSSQMFLTLLRDSLGTTETERKALVIEDFSLKKFKRNWHSKAGKGFNTLANRRVSV
ncbi:hypothetical protein F2Q69_00046091 [Brassica cretica]|uniref:Uncharacterized protein n=1 Tax=Brassica cretica TaxID=69181 RepID=A0A8S9PX10_BRACR|nr:hypothetical protein F2Q69_00046091 [Brassica cretica]